MNVNKHASMMKTSNLRRLIGTLLILAGGILFLDRYLKTGWLSLIILPAVGVFLYLTGARMRHLGMITAGSLLAGIGAGSIAAWGPSIQFGQPTGLGFENTIHPLYTQIGLLSLYIGIAWLVIVLSTGLFNLPTAWWAMIPGGVLSALGVCLLFTERQWADFILYLLVGTGLPLLVWGLAKHLLGLIISGSLILSIGPGIYSGWRTPSLGNTLVQTGIMLVWFAFGWVMISVFGRLINRKYIWWPLIPGGILAMVGIGLYIGGDPGHAIGFISNTGSIALVVFGLYLLLLRKGIHH